METEKEPCPQLITSNGAGVESAFDLLQALWLPLDWAGHETAEIRVQF